MSSVEGWAIRKLRELADVRVSNVDKKSFANEEPVRLCNYMDVYSNEYVTGAIPFMDATASLAEIDRFGLIRGDVIITKDSESPDDIGVPAVVSEEIGGLVCGYHLALIRPSQEHLDSIYLAKQLSTSSVARYFATKASGSTRFGLPVSAIEEVEIPTPPKPEQSKIAEVLSTVDRAIEQTEALIAKQQRIKTGLMQDLLTRGIDEHGNVRSEETHEFKDSPLGQIPVEWEFTTLGSVVLGGGGVLQTGPFGSQLHAYEYVNEGVPIVMPQDIRSGEIEDEHIARIPEDKARSLSRHRVKASDIIFSRRGDLERCAAIREREVGWVCGTGCLLVRAPRNQLDNRWLAAIYQHDLSQRQIVARAVGTTMVNLNTSLLASLQIVKPDVVEQRRIAEILDAHDTRIHAEEACLNKLKSQKTALMQDLLTGRKRVTPLLESEQVARSVS